ncbi:hypothetical protein [Rubricoccus marinus]|uniref:Type 4 fimbrial biogenesis protein PilX N-terminal domain-containing protein n=1 Tax=Rubricoccus marinus TaxID=716817 RepID=A0A259TWI5_9BACT|nr:hypothetical protein [Rubricoccus marinus]OZC01944.1 hypothetical protein BSZ36_02450 [Rubricoccus marinus]
MGQQQLLLLVLGIVIVGLAVVVGIQAFGENQQKSNIDAMTNDGIRIASDAQAWALKPQAFGGGEGNFCSNGAADDDTPITLALLGVDATNVNGTYTLANTACTGITITGASGSSDAEVVVTVVGTDADDISTAVFPDGQ